MSGVSSIPFLFGFLESFSFAKHVSMLIAYYSTGIDVESNVCSLDQHFKQKLLLQAWHKGGYIGTNTHPLTTTF